MVKDHAADRWVQRYFDHLSALGAPALNPVVQVGRIFNETCVDCGWGIRDIVRVSTEEYLEVCAKCRQPWWYEDHVQLRGSFQYTRRPDAFEKRLFPWVDIGRILRELYDKRTTRWAVRVYLVRALSGDSFTVIANEARSRYYRAPWSWNRDRVAELVDEGRGYVTCHLTNAGIIRPRLRLVA